MVFIILLGGPSGKTPQRTNYTATCLPSRKLSKLDEPDTQNTAGEAKTSSYVTYSNGPPHMAKQKQDEQLEHTAAMWGYGMQPWRPARGDEW